MGENLKVVRAEFSFLSLAILVGTGWSVHVIHAAFTSAEKLDQLAHFESEVNLVNFNEEKSILVSMGNAISNER